MAKIVSIPSNLLLRDIDQEAAATLNSYQKGLYDAETKDARKDWEERCATYSRLSGSGVLRRDKDWGSLQEATAHHFLVYKQALWAVFMSVRVRRKDQTI